MIEPEGADSSISDELKPKGLVDALTRFFTPTGRKRACTIKKEQEEDAENEKTDTSAKASTPDKTSKAKALKLKEIGRASCRERV